MRTFIIFTFIYVAKYILHTPVPDSWMIVGFTTAGVFAIAQDMREIYREK